jgi:hypothetical protein
MLGSVDCMQNGRTVHLRYKGNAMAMRKGAPSYLRRLHLKISRFDALFRHGRLSQWHQCALEISGVLSTCEGWCSNGQLWYRWPPPWKRVLFSRLYIFVGPHLWRQSAILKKRKKVGLLNSKKLLGMMWSGHLVCTNLVGLLFGAMLGDGARRQCGRS